jgi:glycosyltransferase involved in cell wall biosynthesis
MNTLTYLKNKINEKMAYYAKVGYAKYMGQSEYYKKSLSAASVEDYVELYKVNYASRRLGPALPISAIVRNKNGETTLLPAIESIITYCADVIIVDNQSTDMSKLMIESLWKKYPDQIRSYQYDKPLAKAGEGYLERVRAGQPGLAEFYNYCFGLGTQEYLLKWDSDNLALPSTYPHFKKGIERGADRIYFDGVDLCGVFSCSNEGRLFRRDIHWTYKDGLYCETSEDDMSGYSRYTASAITFIHLKQLL